MFQIRGQDQILVKLCDFGVSKHFSDSAVGGLALEESSTMGTIPWMAPEFLDNKAFTDKSDMYSFGIFMFEMFCLPFQESKPASPYSHLEPV